MRGTEELDKKRGSSSGSGERHAYSAKFVPGASDSACCCLLLMNCV